MTYCVSWRRVWFDPGPKKHGKDKKCRGHDSKTHLKSHICLQAILTNGGTMLLFGLARSIDYYCAINYYWYDFTGQIARCRPGPVCPRRLLQLAFVHVPFLFLIEKTHGRIIKYLAAAPYIFKMEQQLHSRKGSGYQWCALLWGPGIMVPVSLGPHQNTSRIQIQCGVHFFILDLRRVSAPASKVQGQKHITNLNFAPFWKIRGVV